MLGSTANAVAIFVCGLIGCFFVRGIPSRFEEIIKKAIGLSVLFVGIKGALENERVLLLILSMAGGAVLGELINLDAHLNRLGNWAERRLGVSGGEGRSFSKAFVTTSILYCAGSMAIVGSIQSGLTGNHEILFAKTIVDGTLSIVFGASMGIGVAFSAIPVFLYQSAIVLLSMAARDFLTPEIIREMSAAGSLLVAALGLNILGVKEIRVANLIPAIFIPLVFITIERLVLS